MIQPINALAPRVLFKGQFDDYKQPTKLNTQQKLAFINAAGISTVAGALTTIIARTYTSSWKHAGFFGVATAVLGMLFLTPRFLYKTDINAKAKTQEIDIFTKQKKLISNVNETIESHTGNISDKLETCSKVILKRA